MILNDNFVIHFAFMALGLSHVLFILFHFVSFGSFVVEAVNAQLFRKANIKFNHWSSLVAFNFYSAPITSSLSTPEHFSPLLFVTTVVAPCVSRKIVQHNTWPSIQPINNFCAAGGGRFI
jgi:hypothetical protein